MKYQLIPWPDSQGELWLIAHEERGTMPIGKLETILRGYKNHYHLLSTLKTVRANLTGMLPFYLDEEFLENLMNEAIKAAE
jgi:hypothetical protein